jgi:GT2 family glycosyltransferase
MTAEAGNQALSTGGLAFDLVLATIGRTAEVERFLDSLASQTHVRFRVILVDQNADRRLERIVDRHAYRISITKTVSPPGLSRARNVGLQLLTGAVVAFPDDDCVYPSGLLEQVGDLLDRHTEWDGVTGRTIDATGASSFLVWPKGATLVTRRNVWRTAVATTIFLRREVVEQVGGFDESLGAGAGTHWESGEETDFILRALEGGSTIRYEPSVSVFHESPQPDSASDSTRKAYLTGMGNSRVLRKHNYPAWFAAYRVLQLAGGAIYLLVRGRVPLARFYAAMARGRIRGWLER